MTHLFSNPKYNNIHISLGKEFMYIDDMTYFMACQSPTELIKHVCVIANVCNG